MRATEVYSKLGLTGKGVKIGILDSNLPGPIPLNDGTLKQLEFDLDDITVVEASGCTISPNISTASDYHGHANNTCTAIIGAQTGLAKDADIYATNTDYSNIEEMLAQDIDILEIGVAGLIYERFYENQKNPYSDSHYNEEFTYSFLDKYYDHIVSQHNIITVVPAGNRGMYDNDWFDTTTDENGEVKGWVQGARITSPGMGYNVITVGAYNDLGTGNNLTDDVLYDYSCWKNSYDGHYGCEKPDVVVPASFLGGGTSTAAPALSAVLALMLELKPSLSLQPEVVKAVVLASCHRKVLSSKNGEAQESIYSGITERQGAGAPDAWTMACIISQGTYGYGILNSGETTIYLKQPKYGANNMNVSLTWSKKCIVEEGDVHKPSKVVIKNSPNLDLCVYREDDLIGTSSLTTSSTEMCYFYLSPTSDNYKINIKEVGTITNAKYAYAWSTDNAYASRLSDDGVYYLRNQANNQMMYFNSTYNDLRVRLISNQSMLTDAFIWILKSGTNDLLNILPGYGTLSGGVTNNSTNYAVIGDASADLQLINNADGTVSFVNNTTTKALSYSGSKVVWSSYTGTPTSAQKWYIDKLNYRKGDINTDGMFDITDVGVLQNYLAELVSLNNIQLFLADVDYNGRVTSADVTKIQKILADIDLY